MIESFCFGGGAEGLRGLDSFWVLWCGLGVDLRGDGETKIGFIAQELEEMLPQVVSGEEGDKSITYEEIIPVLVNAIQEQQEIIEEQNQQFAEQERRIEALEVQLQVGR